ncbi:circadian clock protein KaiC [Nocardioides aurantiacus]|uniref:non-specific serine/threonine protein kinase n=1 Tax=Nocardioides aurantiacus TaxID=86796 RepID=A0A3N2CY06_9ACTN|nr:circadian clock protein KaiC [Nocardioides aurantiacus]ROR92366.1 circadian clock protein KaiC [Nocardioides aurantiacus]
MTTSGSGVTGLRKAPTGITGFDEITNGGLPRGRPTLVAGSAGAGKTLFGLEFLVRGAIEHDEPGVLLAFEEAAPDIATNVASMGFDLPALEAEGKIAIDSFRLDPADFIEAGQFDLEGLFIRLELAVASVGARRVVLDTIEVLFAALPNVAVVRSELNRLFRWLKERDLTVVITGERGGGEDQLTRIGIEEFVSDCVVVLDHRVEDGLSTRRMRVTKYRGSLHGTNEYPFLITATGIVAVPITSMGLTYEASDERITTGIAELDEMLSGGIYRGSAMMISGSAGTGKTSIGATMAAASCARGESVLFVSFEESPAQLTRNMRSIGIDLERWTEAGLLQLHSVRATAFGLEEHLAQLHRLVDEHQPRLVVLDAVVSLGRSGSGHDASQVLARDLDLLKSRGVTSVMTTLTRTTEAENSEVEVSSLVDTWLLLRNHETNGERNRLMFVIKSRGTSHSNQVREFVLSGDGPHLVEVYVGPEGVLTGSARVEQSLREQAMAAAREDERVRRRRSLDQRSAALEAQIASLRAELDSDREEFERLVAEEAAAHEVDEEARTSMAQRRGAQDVRSGAGS